MRRTDDRTYARRVRSDVVFDLDLTLIRSATRDSCISVLIRWGLSPTDGERVYEAGKGFALATTVDAAFPTMSEDDRRRIVTEISGVSIASESVEIDGASEVLATLVDGGHRLYLSTGSELPALEAALLRHGWDGVFELALASSADLPKGVGHLERFAESSGASLADWARTTVTVGDGPGEMGFGAMADLAYRCAFVAEEDDGQVSVLRSAGANLRIRDLREVAEIAAHDDPLSEARWTI
jgi:phosphoglycolate phosphatase-like HAD superfamily hydrolase